MIVLKTQKIGKQTITRPCDQNAVVVEIKEKQIF